MKTILSLLFVLQTALMFSQNSKVIPGDKAIVYFTRASALGGAINFTYFDGEKAIGRFNGPKYMIYECDPGEHLFWVRSENKSFVEANLEAGKMYIIDVIPKMGAIKASVKLVPVDKNIYKMKKIQKLLSKRGPEPFSESELNMLQEEMKDVIDRGMENYKKTQSKGKKIPELNPDMTIDNDDLLYIK
ncbi:hypothetical protein [Gaetbulibacter saemankumensis]|uniref:hypothetical protein n=1 Tax=Gaetbulibacter saemankumensis TaxID=311208 RepID=UPI000428E625|nr:hypothetical protein [Gaetbulibacter saemankumensis]